jgi:molybdopterin biosynthesis enzyme
MKKGLHHFVAAHAYVDDEGAYCVERSGAQGSHVYSSIAKADCLIHLAEDLAGVPVEGMLVDVEPFPC